jgi:hypothetical protein
MVIRRRQIVVNAIFILLAASAIVGLILGLYFSWMAILASSLVIAFLSAAVLHNDGFGLLAGMAIIAGCLSVNQLAYLIGATLAPGGRSVPLTDDKSHVDPGVASLERFGNAISIPPQENSKRK